jgi:hypothetical protein
MNAKPSSWPASTGNHQSLDADARKQDGQPTNRRRQKNEPIKRRLSVKVSRRQHLKIRPAIYLANAMIGSATPPSLVAIPAHMARALRRLAEREGTSPAALIKRML